MDNRQGAPNIHTKTHIKHSPSPIILLIDGDVYAYRAASAVEHSVTFDGNTYTKTASLEEAVTLFEDTIRSLAKRLNASSHVVALTDGANFRKELLPTYKANRSGKDRPILLPELRKHILDNHHTYLRPTLEADDVLGILATAKRILPEDSRRIIVSVDKDMLSIPGEFYNSKTGELVGVTPETATYRHMLQTLTGDAVDGYGGCPGVGPKKAAKILHGLSGYGELWPEVLAAFERAGLGEEEALIQSRMARILHASDYDFKNKKVKLWEPPKRS